MTDSMRKVILLLLTAITIHGAVVRNRPTRGDFTYLGSFRNSVASIVSGIMLKPSESDYYISHNNVSDVNAEWEAANKDCKYIFGEGSGLINLETKEEFNNVTEEIKRRGDSGTLYWTGGTYNTESKRWMWSNGVPIGSWAPWDSGHAPAGTKMSRVPLKTVFEPEFSAQYNTVATRYICEIKYGVRSNLAQKGSYSN